MSMDEKSLIDVDEEMGKIHLDNPSQIHNNQYLSNDIMNFLVNKHGEKDKQHYRDVLDLISTFINFNLFNSGDIKILADDIIDKGIGTETILLAELLLKENLDSIQKNNIVIMQLDGQILINEKDNETYINGKELKILNRVFNEQYEGMMGEVKSNARPKSSSNLL